MLSRLLCVGFLIVVILFWVAVLMVFGTFLWLHAMTHELAILHGQLDSQPPFSASHLMSGIPVYYINLTKDSHRNYTLKKQFEKYGIDDVRRVEAVDGRKLSDADWSRLDIKDSIPWSKSTRLGCTLSHLKAIRQAYNDAVDLALICEDDVSFNLLPHWPKSGLQGILSKAPNNWGIINLCVEQHKASITRKQIQKCFVAYHQGSYCLAVAYVINRRGMENVLRNTSNGERIQLLHGENCSRIDADYLIYDSVSAGRTLGDDTEAYAYLGPSLFYPYSPLSSTLSWTHDLCKNLAIDQIKSSLQKSKGTICD